MIYELVSGLAMLFTVSHIWDPRIQGPAAIAVRILFGLIVVVHVIWRSALLMKRRLGGQMEPSLFPARL